MDRYPGSWGIIVKMMITNKLMEKEMKKLAKAGDISKITADLSVLWPEFYEVEGLVLIRRPGEKKITTAKAAKILDYAWDKSEYEWGCSEFRIKDYFKAKNSTEYLKLAFIIAEMWECLFRRDFPEYEFHIGVSCAEGNSTIRYHKYREEEGTILTEDDLDAYKTNAVAVIIVPKSDGV